MHAKQTDYLLYYRCKKGYLLNRAMCKSIVASAGSCFKVRITGNLVSSVQISRVRQLLYGIASACSPLPINANNAAVVHV